MKHIAGAVAVLLSLSGTVQAEGERAGDFDYYLLVLSWNATWCTLEGDDREAAQCDRGAAPGWTLHGLWPQFEEGWPSYCRTSARDPSRGQTGAMADIMGSGGLAWHQWKKHGRCSGLSAEDYFRQSREAYEQVKRPDVLRKLDKDIQVPVAVIEEAFLEANPALEPDQITMTCRANYIYEARICLNRDLQPRRCGADTVRDCRNERALLPAIR